MDERLKAKTSDSAMENEMGTLPVGRLLKKMSLPLIFSMLVQVLYGLIDSLFVARLGDEALTAISLCMPVQIFVAAVGAGVGVGVNAVLSKKLGEGDQKGVNQTAGNGFLLCWGASLLFVLLGAFAMEPFYRMQTDIQTVVDMSVSYSAIISICAFAALHQVMMERMLSATGRANKAMVPMLTGAVVNTILDPIMIFGWLGCPAMGIAGAAYATVIAQALAAIAGLILNIRGNRDIQLTRSSFRPNANVVREIIQIGIPTALSQCLISVLAFGMNMILLPLSVVAPGIYVIYIRLQSFIVVPAGGLGSAGVSIIAYNYGAGKKDRVMQTLRKSIKVNLVVAVIGVGIFLAVPQLLLAMFNASDAMLAVGIPALRIIGIAFPLTGTAVILTSFLQALGRGGESFIVAISQTVLLLGSAWLLALGGNVNLVWLSFPIAELLKFFLALFFVRKTYRKDMAALDDSQARGLSNVF